MEGRPMSTKRTPISRAQLPRVTPQTLAWFVRCEELLADGTGRSDGVNRMEFLDLHARLHLALGLGPWDNGPLSDDSFQRDPPSWETSAHGIASWRRGWALRQQFLAAAKTDGHRPRPRQARKRARKPGKL